jgi:cation transport ATPase
MAEKKETESAAKTTTAKKTTAKSSGAKASTAKAAADKAEKVVEKASEKAEAVAEKAEETVKKTAAKAAEEKPAAKTSSAKSSKTPEKPYSTAGAMERRIGAIICWVLAIVCEIFAICLYTGKLEITFMKTTIALVILIVVDLILVIIGSLLWKKANHIDPASKKNKLKFFLWNNMGVIACIVAFLPFIIVILTDKENKDPQMKKIAGIAAAIALVIGVLFSIEWSPISQEEKTAQVKYSEHVYYTQWGKKYHLYEDCSHINNSDSKTEASVEEAINHGCNGVCKTCAGKYAAANPGQSYFDIQDAVEGGTN